MPKPNCLIIKSPNHWFYLMACLKLQALQRRESIKFVQPFWKDFVITFFLILLSSASSHFSKLGWHSNFQRSKSQSFFCLRETVNTYSNKPEWRLLIDTRQSLSLGLNLCCLPNNHGALWLVQQWLRFSHSSKVLLIEVSRGLLPNCLFPMDLV